MTTGGRRVIAVRDCAYCGDKDAVIVTSQTKAKHRDTKRFCSSRCSRRGTEHAPRRRQEALNKAADLLVAALRRDGLAGAEKAAKAVYHRGYTAGAFTGKK